MAIILYFYLITSFQPHFVSPCFFDASVLSIDLQGSSIVLVSSPRDFCPSWFWLAGGGNSIRCKALLHSNFAIFPVASYFFHFFFFSFLCSSPFLPFFYQLRYSSPCPTVIHLHCFSCPRLSFFYTSNINYPFFKIHSIISSFSLFYFPPLLRSPCFSFRFSFLFRSLDPYYQLLLGCARYLRLISLIIILSPFLIHSRMISFQVPRLEWIPTFIQSTFHFTLEQKPIWEAEKGKMKED